MTTKMSTSELRDSPTLRAVFDAVCKAETPEFAFALCLLLMLQGPGFTLVYRGDE